MFRRFAIAFAIYVPIAIGIATTAHAQQLYLTYYTARDGLVSNTVRRILQDSRGFLWICTPDGMSRYDGHRFTNYTMATGMPHNIVNDLLETPNGWLIFACNDGHIVWMQHDRIVRATKPGPVINRFYKTKAGKVLALTDDNGIYEFNITGGSLYKPPQTFPRRNYFSIKGVNDSLLLLGSDSSVQLMTTGYHLIKEYGIKSNYGENEVLYDSRGRMWTTLLPGLALLDHEGIRPPPAGMRVYPFASAVNHILEDRQGHIWIAGLYGLARMDRNDQVIFFDHKNGLPDNTVQWLLQDREDNLWIATNQGLCKMAVKSDIAIYGENQGLAGTFINSFAWMAPGRVLTVSSKGWQYFDKQKGLWSVVTPPDTAQYLTRKSLLGIGSFFTDEGQPVLLHSGLGQALQRLKLQAKSVNRIVQDHNGIAFIDTYPNGLYIYDDHHLDLIHHSAYKSVTQTAVDNKGTLWLALWNEGLVKISYSRQKGRVIITSRERILQGIGMRSLLIDKEGYIWAGTRYQGLYRLSPAIGGGRGGYQVVQWTTRQGLSSDWVHQMASDEKGNMWIVSSYGLDKLVKQTGGYRVFNYSRVNNFFAGIAGIIPEQGGYLWIATNNSLIHLRDDERENMPAPPVYITGIAIGDSLYAAATMPVRLRHRENNLRIDFSAPSFINEKQVLYSYRLNGGDNTTWSAPENIHSVSYASLRPGDYRFEVRTIGWNGQPGAISQLGFTIRPPFWLTWWFITICALLLAWLISSLYHYRIRQILKWQKARDGIATDLHDDIGSTLTNIGILAELSRKNADDPKKAIPFLLRITDEINSSTEAMDDIIWSVNSRHDSIAETLARMRRFVAELFDQSNIQYHLEIDENIHDRKISMEQRRDVYLMFKEILHNVYKHAQATEINISIKLKNNQLLMSVCDNGCGFHADAATHRNGIKNLHSRARKWKGEMQIDASPGKGSRIDITLPLHLG